MLGCKLIPLHDYRLPMGNGRGIPIVARKGPRKTGRVTYWKKPEAGGHGNRLNAALGVELAHDGIYVELDGMPAHV